jgi:4-methyl-5(b-hydroxyethyl)-thiazole monophosphate biosynthesis
MTTVLIILPEGFEEIEAITPIDLWRRAGFEVTTASLTNTTTVIGRSGIKIAADTRLSAIGSEAVFDLLFLPGGPGVHRLRESPEVVEIVGRHAMAERWIAAICAAPLVLHDVGLLAGRRYTAHPSTQSELTQIRSDENVVIDGKIVTSRGAGTALEFALRIIELLAGKEMSEKIGISICA